MGRTKEQNRVYMRAYRAEKAARLSRAEKEANRQWWERWLGRQPWVAAIKEGLWSDEGEVKAARAVYRRELSGLVPPMEEEMKALRGKKLRWSKVTHEKAGGR